MLTDRYRLERLIAKGGMGRVYLATQLPLEREVALKHLVRPSLNEDFRRRFFLEASVLARLSHPNIVVVHDYGEAPDGSLFMAMEYLNGTTLLDTLRREGRLTAIRACEIAHQVCRALRSAHKQGVAHRDLKPGNIMLLKDREAEEEDVHRDIVKVLDFGLVKVFQEDEDQDVERDLTRAEMMLGSPRYMAPEQIQCTDVDARADVYSLGVVLFAMLTGRPPFVGTTLEILNQHLEAKVPGLNELTQQLKGFNAVSPDVEPVLNSIISKCMEKDPVNRYQSMDELLLELRTAYRMLTDDSLDTPSLEFTRPSLAASITSGIRPIIEQSSHGSGSFARPVVGKSSGATSLVAEPDEAQQQKKRVPLIAAVVIAVLLVVASILYFALTRDDEAAITTTTPTPTTPEAPVIEPIPTATKVSFTSTPRGARVSLAGDVLGTTPVQRELPSGEQLEFQFELEGFQTTKVLAPIEGESAVVHATLLATQAETAEEAEEVEAETPTPAATPPQIARPRFFPQNRPGPNVRARPTPVEEEESAPEPPPPTKTETQRPPTVEERPSRLLVDDPRGAVPVVD
jgi:eukaryotic-like serine/threonine-protein kinase